MSNNNTHGGPRKGAGRKVRQNLHFTLKDAREIYRLLKVRRGIASEMTEEQLIMSLVEQEWQAIDRMYQQVAEIAADGEGTYIL